MSVFYTCVCLSLCTSVLCACVCGRVYRLTPGWSPLNSPLGTAGAGQREGRALEGSKVAAEARLLSFSYWRAPLFILGHCVNSGVLWVLSTKCWLSGGGRGRALGEKVSSCNLPWFSGPYPPRLHLFWLKMLPLWTTFPQPASC